MAVAPASRVKVAISKRNCSRRSASRFESGSSKRINPRRRPALARAHALLLAAGEFVGISIGQVRDAHALEESFDAPVAHFFRTF